MRRVQLVLAVMVALAIPLTAYAQQPTIGSLEIRVQDDAGDSLVGANVAITGPTGSRAALTAANGRAEFRTLPPGAYMVRVSYTGYSTIEVPGVAVNAGQTTTLPIRMTPSKEELVTVISSTPLVDPRQLEISNTFKSDAAESLPIGRNFTDSVAFSPGVVSGLGTGAGNYSIGGSSGLENSYLIDGVNITDSGYGGVGTYSIVFGSLGTGITTDFLEEVQVKTGGFEAEYGQALGGVISGVVKSGTNDFSGALKVFASPTSLESNQTLVSLPTGAINTVDRGETDLGLSMGGPIVKDRVFWFAAYNPVSTEFTNVIEQVDNPITVLDPAASQTYPDPNLYPGAFGSRTITRDRDNYAAKLNFLATSNHWFDLTAFGDPSDGDGRSGISTGTFNLEGTVAGGGASPIKNPAGFAQNGGRSTIDYGADQQSLRYNGLFASDWFVEAQVSHRNNEFTETSVVNDYRYRDLRAYFEWLLRALIGLPGIAPTGLPLAGGAGFIGPTTDETWDYSAKVTKTFGNHEIKFGGQYYDLEYSQVAVYSGPSFTLPFPSETGGTIPVQTLNGALVDVRGGIPGCGNCLISTGAPFYRVTRARFGQDPGPVTGNETSFFVQYTGNLTDKLTLKAGLRSTSQELTGSEGFVINLSRSRTVPNTFSSDPQSFSPNSYKFDTELSPRLGLSVDPWGNGKGKAFLSYARYFERVPADLAVRQFSNEVGTSRFEFTDPQLTNWRGISVPSSTISLQGLTPGTVEPGTKLPYMDEYVLGWEQLIRPDLSFEVRGIYRDQGRVLEDVQFASVEATQNYYYYYDTDGNGVIDDDITEIPFPGFTREPFGSYTLANPGENTVGSFGTPVREYKAVEVEFNKRMSNNWSFAANYRYSELTGNYEGLFRNDNGQSDPNITSLFDFPNSPIMRGQYEPGPLNTDRPHVLNLYGLYVYDFGLELGGAFQWQSGTPRTALLAHPSYTNSGEIPGQDPIYAVYDGTTWLGQQNTGLFLFDYTDAPRGSLGRTPDFASLDLHAGYTAKMSRGMNLKFGLDVFNVFNTQEATVLDDAVEFTTTVPNVNYNKIRGYQLPRSVRVSAMFTW